MAAIRIDESRFPFLAIEFVGAFHDAELEEYLRAIERVLQRRTPYVLVVDASRSTGMSAGQRQRQAAWMKEHTPALRTYCIGMAFIITSPVVRGAMTAILWLAPLPAPYVITASPQEAERWAKERLTERDLLR